MKKLIAGMLVAIAAGVVGPMAAHADVVAVDGTAAGLGIHYVDTAGPSVWEESNGLADLQEQDTVITNEDGSTTVIPHDNQLA